MNPVRHNVSSAATCRLLNLIRGKVAIDFALFMLLTSMPYISILIYTMSTILGGDSFFMHSAGKTPEAIHTWLIMMKASKAIYQFALPPILKEGLGDSDFRVLDVLLHKGPMPVNVIGPKVDLNPGSVSVAVDRLYKKGLVSRVESESDRRVRTVSLTEKGRRVFVPIFRQHAALI